MASTQNAIVCQNAPKEIQIGTPPWAFNDIITIIMRPQIRFALKSEINIGNTAPLLQL
jgi:hypothetical protein